MSRGRVSSYICMPGGLVSRSLFDGKVLITAFVLFYLLVNSM